MALLTLRTTLRAAAAFALACSALAAQAQTYISGSVSGQLAPGVYGTVDIGNAPPPALLYQRPVIIAPVPMAPPPVYMWVPPGHAKNWGKHCARYNACNQPVYFVQEPPPRKGPKHGHHPGRDDRRWDDDHRHGGGKHDRDHGRGHGRGDDRGDRGERGERGEGRGKGHGHRD